MTTAPISETQNVVSLKRGRPASTSTTVINKLSENATKKLLRSIVEAVSPAIEETVMSRVRSIQQTQTPTPTPPSQKEEKAPRVRPERTTGELSQAEKVLSLLLSGKVTPFSQITKQLKNEIAVYRLSVYLWELKKLGANIVRHKEGRKIVALQLKNQKQMQHYMEKRNEELKAAA